MTDDLAAGREAALARGLRPGSTQARLYAEGYTAGVKAGRVKAAEEIRAHADKHAPPDGNIQQRRLRRHLLIAANVAAPKPTLGEVVEAMRAGNFAACHLDESGRPVGEEGTGD